MGCRITHIEYYLPQKVLSNNDLSMIFPGFDSGKIKNKIGIENRHIAAEGETALDMAERACISLFKGYDKKRIDFIVFCTQSPDYYLPTSACILQHRLGLSNNIGAIDYNLGCSGYIYGLAMAKSFIETGIANNVLLITGETYSKYIHPKDKSNRMIFGDAAAATIIEKTELQYIGEFILGTDGAGSTNLIVKNGAARQPFRPEAEEYEYSPGSISSENCLYMNGPEIFNFTIEAVPKIMDQVIIKNKITLEEVDYFIYHQANAYMLEYLRKKSNIPENKFYIDLRETGNSVSSTIPIALKDSIHKGIVDSGKQVLLIGFGVGYSWGSVLIKI